MADLNILQPGPLAEIGRALQGRLALAFPPNLFTFQWMPARVDRAVWNKLIRGPRTIGLGFNRFDDPQMTGLLSAISHWSVYLMTKNESGSEALMFGDKLAPGFFALAQVGAAMLHGHTIKGIGTVQVTECANSFIEDYGDDGLAIATIELKVPVCLSLGSVLGGDGLKPADLTGQTIQWSFDGTTVAQTDITNPGTS